MELNDDALAQDQRRYARVLGWITSAGFVGLVVFFLVYTFGLLEPHVAHHRLPELWRLPAHEFLEATGIGPGWGWTAWLHRGDLLTLVGIATLAFASVPCLAAIMPFYWATRQRALLAICAAEIVVILLAASGLVSGAH
jgi:hypothetical protein